MLERIARALVGGGLLWSVLVVAAGLALGLGVPRELFAILDTFVSPATRQALYLGLALGVVPAGMLLYLWDLLGDPIPLWLKAAAPGAFVSFYLLFLAAALPEVGQPFLALADPAVAAVAGPQFLESAPDATWTWLVRFLASLAVLGGIPGALGGLARVLGGVEPGRPR